MSATSSTSPAAMSSVVGRVKVNGYGLDPCFIGCTPIVDRTLVHGASLTLRKKAFNGAVGTSCFFCELRVQCLPLVVAPSQAHSACGKRTGER